MVAEVTLQNQVIRALCESIANTLVEKNTQGNGKFFSDITYAGKKISAEARVETTIASEIASLQDENATASHAESENTLMLGLIMKSVLANYAKALKAAKKSEGDVQKVLAQPEIKQRRRRNEAKGGAATSEGFSGGEEVIRTKAGTDVQVPVAGVTQTLEPLPFLGSIVPTPQDVKDTADKVFTPKSVSEMIETAQKQKAESEPTL